MATPLVTCMKGLFLVFNFVFWLTGLALLVVGILTKFAFSYLMKLSTDVNFNLAPYIMIGCGVFIVLIGFVGCWAAVKEHSWALKIYMVVLIILFIVELAGSITGYVLRNKMKSGLKEGLQNAVKKYYTDKDLKEAIDKVQESYVKCCGVNTYKDYLSPVPTTVPTTATNTTGNSTTGNSTTTAPTTVVQRVPKSCCDKNAKKCYYDNLNNAPQGNMGIYKQGCYDELVSKAKKNLMIVGGVALGIAVFQILGVICAYILTKQFKETYEKM